jgi:glycosyl transferase family 25
MIPSYLINLDQDVQRLSFFASTFKRLGIEFERIQAVDGRLFAETDYQAFMQARPRHDKTWLRGQMGCFLSHYAAWEKIARGGQRFCAVFEDDIHVSDDLRDILADDRWLPDDVDIIRLETSTNRVRLTPCTLAAPAGRPLFAVHSTSWCAGAYLINRRTAQQLIDLPAKDHEPADVMLYHLTDSVLAAKLKILQFNPAPCTQDKHLATGSINFASNIEDPLSRTAQLKAGLAWISPWIVGRAIFRSLRAYRRIGFR